MSRAIGCVIVLLLLAGCLHPAAKERPSGSPDSSSVPQGSTDGGQNLPVGLTISAPSEEQAQYRVLSDGAYRGTLNISLTHSDGMRAQINYEKRDETMDAVAEYEQGSGRLMHLLVTERQSETFRDYDEFWPGDEEAFVPLPNPTASIVDVVPLAGRFLAEGFNPLGISTTSRSATIDSWTWSGRVECRSACSSYGLDIVSGYDISIEGDSGLLPARTTVKAGPDSAFVEIIREWEVHSLDSTMIQPRFEPMTPISMMSCGRVPCDGNASGLRFATGWQALQNHPVWLAWAQQNPSWILLQALVSRGPPIMPTAERIDSWTFDTFQQGGPIARFTLRQSGIGGTPVMAYFNPAISEWNDAFSGTVSRMEWPDVDAMAADWVERIPIAADSPLDFAVLFFGPPGFPDTGRAVTISFDWEAADGRGVIMSGFAGDGLPRQALWAR